MVAIWHERPSPATRAFDLATGAVRWEQLAGLYTAAPGDRTAGAPFVATGDGKFSAWVGGYDLVAGGRTGRSIMPASFEPSVVPAVDRHDFVVIDRIGQVTAIDPVSGEAALDAWTSTAACSTTQVVLLPRRVVVTTLSGELFVLDRVSGSRRRARRRGGFDGLPIAVAALRHAVTAILVAFRLTEPGRVEMRRVP